jgi:hypothetical protein
VPGIMLFWGLVLAAACVQPGPPMSVDLAEAQCARSVPGGGSQSTVSIGVGTGVGVGYGGWGWGDDRGGGSRVGVSTTIPVRPADPEAAQNSCVLRKSGKPPDTPSAKRPEVVGQPVHGPALAPASKDHLPALEQQLAEVALRTRRNALSLGHLAIRCT